VYRLRGSETFSFSFSVATSTTGVDKNVNSIFDCPQKLPQNVRKDYSNGISPQAPSWLSQPQVQILNDRTFEYLRERLHVIYKKNLHHVFSD
jgi:hypothetical protein